MFSFILFFYGCTELSDSNVVITTIAIMECAAPFIEQLLCRVPPKLKRICYKDTKEKDQMIFFNTSLLFVSQGIKFKQY